MTSAEAKNKEQYAINRLQDAKDGYKEYLTDEAIDIAIKAIEQTRWIPCSERLPEKNMDCLVAVGEINLTQTAMYSDLMGTIDHKIFYQGDYGHENFVDITQYVNVNAWMPLPEPLPKPYVPDIYDGNMSEIPTGSEREVSE